MSGTARGVRQASGDEQSTKETTAQRKCIPGGYGRGGVGMEGLIPWERGPGGGGVSGLVGMSSRSAPKLIHPCGNE